MLLALFSHPTDSFRVMALTCINSLISLSPQALLLNMDAYLEVGGWVGDVGQMGERLTRLRLK